MHQMKNLAHIGDNKLGLFILFTLSCNLTQNSKQIYKVLQNIEYHRMQLSEFPCSMSTIFKKKNCQKVKLGTYLEYPEFPSSVRCNDYDNSKY